MKWYLAVVAAFALGLWLRGRYHLVAAPEPTPIDDSAVARGERVFLREGCYGCHAVSEWPTLPLPAPALDFARSKLSREFIYTWLTCPQAYRPDLRVSSHFLRDDSETTARALTAYLLRRSPTWSPAKWQSHGGGEALYTKLACAACHGEIGEGFSNMGVKTNATWLTNYLRKPAAYDAHTTMPDYRLSAADADALATTLSVQNDGIFEVRFPHLTRQTVEAVDAALAAEGVAVVGGVPLEQALLADKEVALGERRYAEAGCGGCHALSGVPRSDAAVSTARDSMPTAPQGALAAMGRRGTHVQFALSAEEQGEVSAFLQRPWHAKLGPEEAGAFHMRALACAACHERKLGPSLIDEGRRVQPEWLFTYMAKPFNLVKHDKGDKKSEMLPVMPTFALSDDALNDIVLTLNAGHVRFETPPPAHGATSECKSCHDLAALRARFRPSYVESYLRTHPSAHDADTAAALTGAVFAP